jgi:hypothetical protein
VESRESRDRKGKKRSEGEERFFFFSQVVESGNYVQNLFSGIAESFCSIDREKRGQRREVIEKREDREEKIFFFGGFWIHWS